MLEGYLPPEQVAEVYRAYLFGAEAHEGQRRLSGEPYIYHPIEVARILAEMRMDYRSIVAAMLHDVLEDTNTPLSRLTEEFGQEVADLVDGLSKLTQIRFESRAEAKAENLRKMLMAVARDIRVILIKLADRLHNMQTLGAMRPDKRRRIARETLEIYAPIANRLGMNRFRVALENEGFQALYPMRARILARAVERARGNRKEVVDQLQNIIQRRLDEDHLQARVIGREKHLYGIYRKMQQKGVKLSDIMDIYAVRIIVGSVDECYRALGAIHTLFRPVPGRFKDYVAIPKANGYQSLHTTILGPHGLPVEVQIRTQDMDRVAEAGIAAHWLYKSGEAHGGSVPQRAREWLQGLLDIQKQAGNPLEFLEHVKVDLFPDEVYVFTPRGEIMRLPRGATGVDFAYAVHTEVGNTCVAIKIDRQLAPLRTELGNGQTVEVITAPGSRPNPAWLDFVVTAKARANIRQFLKNLQRDEAVALGERLLDKALAAAGTQVAALPQEQVRKIVKEFKLDSLDDLLEQVGLGNRMPALIARRLMPPGSPPVSEADAAEESAALIIKGTEGMVVHLARCCHPIPGDAIQGIYSAGRGIVIHLQSCRNLAEFRNQPEKWVDVAWSEAPDGDFHAEVRIEADNRRGVLARVASTISGCDSNIENVAVTERDGHHSTLVLLISVRDRRHLADIMRRLKKLEEVLRIQRNRS